MFLYLVVISLLTWCIVFNFYSKNNRSCTSSSCFCKFFWYSYMAWSFRFSSSFLALDSSSHCYLRSLTMSLFCASLSSKRSISNLYLFSNWSTFSWFSLSTKKDYKLRDTITLARDHLVVGLAGVFEKHHVDFPNLRLVIELLVTATWIYTIIVLQEISYGWEQLKEAHSVNKERLIQAVHLRLWDTQINEREAIETISGERDDMLRLCNRTRYF